MGMSSSKSSTKPIYDKQITGAATTAQNVYEQNAPKVQGYADSIGALLPGMIEKYNAGDPGVKAAQGYNAKVLGGEYLGSNPYLQQMIDQTNNSVQNRMGASLAKRGLNVGGSTYQDLIGRGLAENETGLRYGDYNAERDRMANAAGMSGALAAADTIQINPILAASQTAAGLPMDSVGQFSSIINGLLGQYTKSKTSQPWGGALLGGAVGGLNAYLGSKGGG